MTTGATGSACAFALKRAGAKSVTLLTVARVDRREHLRDVVGELRQGVEIERTAGEVGDPGISALVGRRREDRELSAFVRPEVRRRMEAVALEGDLVADVNLEPMREEEIRVSRLRGACRGRLQETRSGPNRVTRGACLPGEYQGGEGADADQQWSCSHESSLVGRFVI